MTNGSTGADSFLSAHSYKHFAAAVKRQNRFFFSDETRSFLKAVDMTSGKRRTEVPSGTIYYRAQLGTNGGGRGVTYTAPVVETPDERVPHPFERMVPRAEYAPDGRINPKGLPYLYLATEGKTAMSEVRPSTDNYVTLGKFKTVRDLALIDCSREHEGEYVLHLDDGPDAPSRELAVWRDIDRAFAKPVAENDPLVDYIPTQILGEFFRTLGYQGIKYKSRLGDGYNIALFELAAAECVNCALYLANRVTVDFELQPNP